MFSLHKLEGWLSFLIRSLLTDLTLPSLHLNGIFFNIAFYMAGKLTQSILDISKLKFI